ncbi:hypothetical protein BGW38_009451, partial [Lunasporangiospora selenospora]
MGVKGCWQLLRNKGYVPDVSGKPCSPSPASKIRVDVCGSYFSTISYAYGCSHPNVNDSHRLLERQLISLGDKDKLVLYVDGYPAAEKADTHHLREQRRVQASERANSALDKLNARLETNKRIRKHHIGSAKKAIKSAFYWTMDSRQAFVEFMASQGYNITLCLTEADVQIAADCNEDDVVVTGDSDLLFYESVRVVCRPLGRGASRRFGHYHKAGILETLCLTSTQLVALAVISGNDYTNNIPSLGIETNHKLIMNLRYQDVVSTVQQYLILPTVRRKIDKDEKNDWTLASFGSAIK